MSTENKTEKAGAPAPATPSKVDGAQKTVQTDDLKVTEHSGEIESLKAEVAEKDNNIASKDQEIESLKAEVESLKGDVKSLEGRIEKATKKGKASKTEKRFVVINSFRGNQKGENGKIYAINEDVSDLDPDRLKDLVSRDLVREV